MRRLLWASVVLIGISGTVLAMRGFSETDLLGSATAQEGVEDGSDPDSEDAAEDAAIVAEDCLDLQDPRDPLRNTAAAALHDDEILDLVNTDAGFARELVTECGKLASAAGAGVPGRQMRYGVARLELALDRRDDAADSLRAISDAYPSAAWRAARMTIEDEGALELNSTEFDKTLELLIFAHRGKETRADADLEKLLLKIVPVHEFSFPTLAASVYFDRPMPDNEASRMALLSYFGGFYTYCEKWETFAIEPADLAAVNNARVEMEVNRFFKMIESLPAWAGNIKQWIDNIGSITLDQGLRDFNTAKATPAQLLYIVNTAGLRDGYQAAEAVGCSGSKAERTITNMIRIIKDRSNARLAPTRPDDLQALMRKPDLLSLI